ncbi:hypothetical protein ACFL1R_02150 [Candidatus Latescibacterota bacterium]
MRAIYAVLVFTAFFLQGIEITGAQNRIGMVGFDRNDRILSWQTRHSGDFNLSDDLGLKLDSTLSTRLNIASRKSVKDRWYDQVYNRAEIDYRFSDKLDFSFTALEDWNKDSMSRLGTSLLTTDYLGSIRYIPFANLSIKAGAGHIFDRRFDNIDRGARVTGLLDYSGKPFKNISLDLKGNAETSNLKRSQESYRLDGNLSYDHASTTVSVGLGDSDNLRGYFSDVDRRKIEERKSRNQITRFQVKRGDFNYSDDTASFEFNVNWERKHITDSANSNPLSTKYRNNARGNMKEFNFRTGRRLLKRITTEWGMDYSKNNNGVERLSRRRTQTDIATQGLCSFGFGLTDSVEVVGRIKRTRIDTPAGFTNDRDELKFEGGIQYSRYFSDNFKTLLDFRVLETHYVNIDVSQASQNKWMKTYFLSPSLYYSPMEALTVSHKVNIYANYIDFDYDWDYRPRSNISRRFSSESSIDMRISPRTSVTMEFMFEKNDYGKLLDNGNKIPTEEGLKRLGDISIEYIFTKWFTLSPHYVYSVRHDWSLGDNMRDTLRREVDQTYGLNCDLFKNENGSFEIGAKRIVRVTKRYPKRIRDYITMSLNYGF